MAFNPDGNVGSPLGVSNLVENWHNGQRQIASQAYGLVGVEVMTDTLVQKVIIEKREGAEVATGVQLVDGKVIKASKEVIVCAGAFRTPQIMMLSGIGAAGELKKYGIPLVVDAPAVGTEFHDHLALSQWWKLRKPEEGQAIGTSRWTSPGFFVGLPCDVSKPSY